MVTSCDFWFYTSHMKVFYCVRVFMEKIRKIRTKSSSPVFNERLNFPLASKKYLPPWIILCERNFCRPFVRKMFLFYSFRSVAFFILFPLNEWFRRSASNFVQLWRSIILYFVRFCSSFRYYTISICGFSEKNCTKIKFWNHFQNYTIAKVSKEIFIFSIMKSVENYSTDFNIENNCN